MVDVNYRRGVSVDADLNHYANFCSLPAYTDIDIPESKSSGWTSYLW